MTEEPMLDYVIRNLKESPKPLRLITAEADVSYFTVQKWLRSHGTRNPRVETVQKLANYFRAEPPSPVG